MKIQLNELFKKNSFLVNKIEKKMFFNNLINNLNLHHFQKCKEYREVIDSLNCNIRKNLELKECPALPINLFKEFDLMSIQKKQIVKKIFSSGTSSNKLSKIYLDKENSINQIKALSSIMQNFLGKERLPMLIVSSDPKKTLKNNFNAKYAAILGFSIFGKEHTYVLDELGNFDFNKFLLFYEKNKNKKILIFGFTGDIYTNLINNKKLINHKIKLNNAILLHGGGWKKLEKLKIDNKKFKYQLDNNLKIKRVINYYGLVEQTGSIFVEGDGCGYLHTTIFSDVIIRGKNFEILNFKKKGLVQLISCIPTSYPGHNILTEDLGEIIGEDDCKCGYKGKYFKIHGRIKESDIRGCSDAR
jgi:hypothetical protein